MCLSGNNDGAARCELLKETSHKQKTTIMKKLLILILFYLVVFSATGCNPCADPDPSETGSGSTDILGIVIYPGDEGGGTYSFSSDGKQMNLFRDDAVPTSDPQLGMVVYALHPELSHGESELIISDVNGKNPRTILKADNTFELAYTVLSPDAKHVLFIKDGMRGSTESYLWIIGTDGTGERLVSPIEVDEILPAFSPDGNSFAYVTTDGNLHVQGVNGTEFGIIANDATPYGDVFSCVAWSKQNIIAYESTKGSGTTERVTIIRPDGSNKYEIPTTGNSGAPHWNMDGSKLVFHCEDGNLYTTSNIGNDLTPVVSGNGKQPSLPRWSPDGKKILYTLVDDTHPDYSLWGDLTYFDLTDGTAHYVGSSVLFGFWKN
jgi:Tol biopolymer transport system component